jgi:hypothetical protein
LSAVQSSRDPSVFFSNWRWPNFKPEEFRCSHSGEYLLVPDFLDKVQMLRSTVAAPFVITSAYRHVSHPKERIKRVPGSHNTGRAVDIALSGEDAWKLVVMAGQVGMTGIGVLGEDKATDDVKVATTAIQQASTEDLIKLKEVEQNFALQMEKLGLDVKKLHQADRASARQRQVATKDKMPAVIAVAVLAGFFGILGAMIFADIPEAAQMPVSVMLGALATLVTQIGAFYYGSSDGSTKKNAMIERLTGGNNGR